MCVSEMIDVVLDTINYKLYDGDDDDSSTLRCEMAVSRDLVLFI